MQLFSSQVLKAFNHLKNYEICLNSHLCGSRRISSRKSQFVLPIDKFLPNKVISIDFGRFPLYKLQEPGKKYIFENKKAYISFSR